MRRLPGFEKALGDSGEDNAWRHLIERASELRGFPRHLFWRHSRQKRVRDRMAAKIDPMRLHTPDLVPSEHLVFTLAIILSCELPEDFGQPFLALRIGQTSH